MISIDEHLPIEVADVQFASFFTVRNSCVIWCLERSGKSYVCGEFAAAMKKSAIQACKIALSTGGKVDFKFDPIYTTQRSLRVNGYISVSFHASLSKAVCLSLRQQFVKTLTSNEN